MKKLEILLIDDDKDKLKSLSEQVRCKVGDTCVRTWYPEYPEYPEGSNDLSREFDQQVSENTALVITDYDLTKATHGLSGHSVVAWCRNKFVPVGDFSRGHPKALSEEPDLFELRVPRAESDAADYIARMFRGFRQVQSSIERDAQLLDGSRSPAHVLASNLERFDLESEFSPYLSRPGQFNSSLLDALVAQSSKNSNASLNDKMKLLTYILGHVLVNTVLKYPGPILAERPLCAYLALSYESIEKIKPLLEDAEYTGPFSEGEKFYWRDKVDEKIEQIADNLGVDDSEFDSLDCYRRNVLERALDSSLANHECIRCEGKKGGFWCPFRKRAVCENGDCSSTASSWIPSGAYACRVEKEFYEEWSPILGL